MVEQENVYAGLRQKIFSEKLSTSEEVQIIRDILEFHQGMEIRDIIRIGKSLDPPTPKKIISGSEIRILRETIAEIDKEIKNIGKELQGLFDKAGTLRDDAISLKEKRDECNKITQKFRQMRDEKTISEIDIPLVRKKLLQYGLALPSTLDEVMLRLNHDLLHQLVLNSAKESEPLHSMWVEIKQKQKNNQAEIDNLKEKQKSLYSEKNELIDQLKKIGS